MRSVVHEHATVTGHRPANTTAAVLGIAVLIAAVLSMIGWLVPVYRLTDWDGNGITIKFNAALTLTLVALSFLVYLLFPKGKPIIWLLALSAATFALLILSQRVIGPESWLDNIFVYDNGPQRATLTPGRMGIPGSVTLSMLGIAIVLATTGPRGRRAASGIGLLVISITSLSLVGYLFGADELYQLPRTTGIALQTALMICSLAVALVSSIPEHGIAAALRSRDAGGQMFRRLVAPVIFTAVVLGFLRVLGQQANLYDTAFGTALRTVVEIILLVAMLWWAASGVSRAERRLSLVSRIPEENPSPVLRLTPAGEVLYGNPRSADLVDLLEGDPAGEVSQAVTNAVAAALRTNEQQRIELNVDGCSYLAVMAPVVEEGYVNLYASDITARFAAEQKIAAQANEQAVLYRLTDRVHRAESAVNVYEAALDAVVDGLGCDRASILLFDAQGVMSFVASRGLSAEYQTAVNGHSPWRPGDRDTDPITIRDIASAEISEELRRKIVAEGIRSLGFVPLNSSAGDVIGKFMVYYDQPHEWTEAELGLAVTVGRQIAFGIERRQTEQALRENEERLRLATQTGKVGIWDWNIAADHVAWTESLYAMHGIRHEDFDGSVTGFAKLVHPDDVERVKEALQDALAGEHPYDLEFRTIRPDGSTAWLFTTAVTIGDGDDRRMIGATVDVTERKEAQLAAERLASLVRSSMDAIIGLDLNGIITSWNVGAERTFGYAPDEIVGKSIITLVPEDSWSEESAILARIRSGEVIEHYETTRVRKGGIPVDISLSISPLRAADGSVIGASKIARDVTLRKRADAAIRGRETLQRIVEAQEAERSRIARDLHDHLGQQLTGLRLKLESIKAAAAAGPAADMLKDASEQAMQIDTDLSLLAWEMRPVFLETHGLSEALGSFIRDWSQNRGIPVEFQCTSQNGRLAPEVETNLYRIVQEALNNILKHASASEVSVTLNQTAGETVLVIEDNGTGFDYGETSASPTGGLGLIGMRERATILGGRLDVESTPGGGTTVFARIPVNPAPRAATN